MSQRELRPVKGRLEHGDPFDFGSHANDFLVKREEACGTEVFVVRVPGRGAVPPHVHTDMEQTFVFTSGAATAVLAREDERVEFACRPGDVVFVPIGWWHSVAASSLEEVTYITVNAFVDGVEREGDTAIEHAQWAEDGFRERGVERFLDEPALANVDLHRTAETAFRLMPGQVWGQDFSAFDATLRTDPSAYRVNRVGPFEFVERVEASERVFTRELGDLVASVSVLPVFVEGSQSPLSVKHPYAHSDIDLLVAVSSAEEIPTAHKVLDQLRQLQGQFAAPLAPGIVHRDWLDLPALYSAVELGPDARDRQWWRASTEDRLAEAHRRLQAGLELAADTERMRSLFEESLSWARGADFDVSTVTEWRLTPRWWGYDIAYRGPQ